MNYTQTPRKFAALAAAAVFGLLLTSSLANAQTIKTVKGDFHSTDGNSGTYVRTISIDLNTTMDTVVYTRDSDQATSTSVTITTKNPDKSHLVTFRHTDYGSTGEFTSTKTIAKVKGGRSGTGTYTNAQGESGTLTSLEVNADSVHMVNVVYTSATGQVTTDVRVEVDALGFVEIKSLSLAPDGTTKSSVTTRYVTSID